MTTQVAIIYGGKSVEHEVSIRSARNVVEHLASDFEVTTIGISKSGNWFKTDSITDHIESGSPLSLDLSSQFPRFNFNGASQPVGDIVFPILHGTDGEDGSVQGLFQTLNLPVVGSDVLGSSVSMDKVFSKKLLKAAGIPVAPYLHFTIDEKYEHSFDSISKELGSPFMVKAGNLGSSVGISKVNSEEDYISAIDESFGFSNSVSCESFIEGKEMECGIIGNEKIETTLPGLIDLVGDYDFYTYEAKYQDENAINMVIPAPISSEISDEIRKWSAKAYRALGCKDYSRVDLFVTSDNQVIINEINTIPGFTNASMFPSLWKNMGLQFTALLSKIIDLTITRFEKERQLERNYFSD